MAAQLLQLMRSYGVEPNDVTFTSILSEMSKAKQVKHHFKEQFYCCSGLLDGRQEIGRFLPHALVGKEMVGC